MPLFSVCVRCLFVWSPFSFQEKLFFVLLFLAWVFVVVCHEKIIDVVVPSTIVNSFKLVSFSQNTGNKTDGKKEL